MTRSVLRRHELLAWFTLSHLSLPQPLLVCAEPAFLRRSAVTGAGAPAQVPQLRQGKRVCDSIFQARAAAEDQFDVTKSCSAAEYQLCQMVQELEQEKKGHRQLAFDFNNLLTMSTNAETHLKQVCIVPLLFVLTPLDLQASPGAANESTPHLSICCVTVMQTCTAPSRPLLPLQTSKDCIYLLLQELEAADLQFARMQLQYKEQISDAEELVKTSVPHAAYDTLHKVPAQAGMLHAYLWSLLCQVSAVLLEAIQIGYSLCGNQ